LQQFSIPVDADVFDEVNWPLANPAIDAYRSREEMRAFAKRAKLLPSLERTFRNLYCNQRVQSQTVFISPGVWKSNTGAAGKLTKEQWALLMDKLRGQKCYAGLDLSGKVDLTSLVLVFPQRTEGGTLISPDFPFTEVIVIPFFWTPRDTILERTKKDKVPYFEWWQQGYLEAPQGFSINFGYVAERIAQLAQQFKIEAIAADRWNLKQLIARLVEQGYKEAFLEEWIVPHGQGFKDMSPAVNVLEEALLGSRLQHGLHPVLTYNAASAVVDKDAAENRKFYKNKSTGRIDGIVALAMGLNLASGAIQKRKARGITTL
jgi:phage terminase large subunit-like protein